MSLAMAKIEEEKLTFLHVVQASERKKKQMTFSYPKSVIDLWLATLNLCTDGKGKLCILMHSPSETTDCRETASLKENL